MSDLTLPFPVDRVRGPHHPAGSCPFCGGSLRKLTCTRCGNNRAVDCRRNLAPCEHPGCVRRGEAGVDLHDVWDGHDLHLYCEDHCPECAGPEEQT